MAKTRNNSVLLDPKDTLVLFIDHQSGLLQTVKDMDVMELRANTAALAKAAKLMKIPVIATTSMPEGPNGPLIPEILQNAPHASIISRNGEINAWGNEDFAQAVRRSGKKTLVMAGIWTSVCVALPALTAHAEGYKVYAVFDASGDISWNAGQITLARLTQAGVIPSTTNAVVAELQKTWNRRDAMQFVDIYSTLSPSYRAVVESHRNAEDPTRRK